MPQITASDGLDHVVPGVYGTITVQQGAAAPQPTFQVPVLIADSDAGYPSDWLTNADRLTAESSLLPFIRIGDVTQARRVFGGDLAQIFGNAQTNGLPLAGCIGAGKMRRAGVIVRSTGPVSEFDLASFYWGFPGNWVKIKWASSIFSFLVPTKLVKVTANAAAGDTRVYVTDSSWAVPGMSLEIGDNDTANEAVTVRAAGVDFSPTGQPLPYIDLTAALSGTFATADYAAIALYGSAAVTSPTFSAGQGQNLIDWLNRAQANGMRVFRAQRRSTFTGALPLAVSSLTPMKQIAAWGAVTKGTSPTASASDYADFLADMVTLLPQFIASVRAIPRAWFAGTTDLTAQESWRDYAITMRAANKPISVTFGCAWGDVDLTASDSTNPVYRASQLNSEDVDLVACGADGYGSYLTLAAAKWGRMCGSAIPHNLTNDPFVGFTSFEARWSEGDVESLCRGGVVTYTLPFINGAVQPCISQGLSTLQANLASWNIDNTTWSRQYRDNADLVDRALRLDLESQIVGYEVDVNAVRAVGIARGAALLRQGYLSTLPRLTQVERNPEQNGWTVVWQVLLPSLTDYVDLNTLIIPE